MAPSTLKPFVANRIAEIQELSKHVEWRYTPTKQNPADLVFRGLSAKLIVNSNLWWCGPEFLGMSEENWPTLKIDEKPSIEIKPQNVSLLTRRSPTLFPFENFSNFLRLKRCTAYICRFIKNCKVSRADRQVGELSLSELDFAYKKLIYLSQLESFPEEFDNLTSKNHVHKGHNALRKLSPFIDADGLLRVGGRLSNGSFPYDKKHPYLLSSKHRLTKLILTYEHKRLLHAGPQQLLYAVREVVWPVSGRNLARSVVHHCLRCYRFKAKAVNPIMGNLPAQRLQYDYPFRVTGVDYAGPLNIKDRKGRGAKVAKCYIALFVCFTTKALHLELVGDLSKDAFLSAFKRFAARRGKPLEVFSDNGKNFVGANAEIQKLYKFFKENESDIVNSAMSDGIRWHFNPAYAPHFGGLWEAGVKSMKFHLKRVIGNTSLTFEELSTILAQTESILNSRPLTPMSTDPADLQPLTPGHFLIGRPLVSLPESNLEHIPIPRLSRYQLIEQIRQHIWRRWKNEYVSELQSRTKWTKNQDKLKEGSMVLVKDDSLPPLTWSIGRIIQTFPGKDGVTRVASIQTTKGVIRRAFPKLCPLPINPDVERHSFQGRGHVSSPTPMADRQEKGKGREASQERESRTEALVANTLRRRK